MRHGVAFRKLSRNSAHRRALLRNMAASLILHERFETTFEKAKELQRVIDKLITVAKKETLHARRQALSYIPDKDAVHKLFKHIAPGFKNRSGGYCRVVRTGFRHGDAAQLAMIEFVERESTTYEKGKQGDSATKGAARAAKASKAEAKKSAKIKKEVKGTAKKAATPAKGAKKASAEKSAKSTKKASK